eukprot:4942114-Prymnesium_polylepis.1
MHSECGVYILLFAVAAPMCVAWAFLRLRRGVGFRVRSVVVSWLLREVLKPYEGLIQPLGAPTCTDQRCTDQRPCRRRGRKSGTARQGGQRE